MNNDEIASRLIDTLKGGAYLIASSIFFTGIFLVALTKPLESSSDENSVFLILQAIAALGFLIFFLSQIYIYSTFFQKARKLLDR
jgi:low affinity Fe/Cu permease